LPYGIPEFDDENREPAISMDKLNRAIHQRVDADAVHDPL
jgi:hypothetical protein